MTPEPPDALTATWSKHDIAQLLTVYEDEIDRSGCFPFQEDREEWDGSGWHAFEIRDEILRRFIALLDQADEAARLAGEAERLRTALATLLLYARGNQVVLDLIHAALDPPEPSGGEG